MSNTSDMQIHESLALLNELNLIEWLSRDVEASTRLVINALVVSLLDTDDPVEYLPSSPSDAVVEVLTNQRLNKDWFELVSGSFFDGVELNAQSIGYSISDLDSMLTDEEAKQAAVAFAKDWESQARTAIRKAVGIPEVR
jgi:hypothetical protein